VSTRTQGGATSVLFTRRLPHLARRKFLTLVQVNTTDLCGAALLAETKKNASRTALRRRRIYMCLFKHKHPEDTLLPALPITASRRSND
jgi:hypothetical protein